MLLMQFEYTINQGIAPTLVYPPPSPTQHPIPSKIIHTIRDYYPLWQVRIHPKFKFPLAYHDAYWPLSSSTKHQYSSPVPPSPWGFHPYRTDSSGPQL